MPVLVKKKTALIGNIIVIIIFMKWISIQIKNFIGFTSVKSVIL